MQSKGLRLTQIGSSDFLLEPSRSLDIQNQGALLELVITKLQESRGKRLYYDLSEQVLIDPVYYAWLNALAVALYTINVTMVCTHMQPTAAYALAQNILVAPKFETAIDIAAWRKSS